MSPIPSTTANKAVSSPIVREPLFGKDNYNDWSVQVKNYLVAQDLWDVVEADQAPDEDEAEALKAWRKTNAAALHAIQISCSSYAFFVIREISSAKSAWDTLMAKFEKKPFPANENNARNDDYDCFFSDVGKGSWTTAMEFLTLHPEAVRVTSSMFGRTALHVAVTFGHLHIVEELVNLMTPQDLEIQQKVLGETAFEMAVGKGNIPMAKCMVEKNQNLLCIVNSSGLIPIALAVNHGQKEMARYLYPLTLQQEVLLLDSGKHGADLMSKSIHNDMFDIVLDLISRHPHLTIANDTIVGSAVDALAFRPTLFLSGCQLAFWQQWIYNSMHVRLHPATDVCLNIPNNVEDRARNKWDTRGWSTMFQWVASNLLKLLGINHIYELKVAHTHAAEVLDRMCKVIETLNAYQIREAGIENAIVGAASRGIVEVVTNISKAISIPMWNLHLARTIFESAIRNREAKVFSLMYGIDDKQAITDLYDSNGDSLHHVTGYIANSRKLNRISGAALQMQSEMQWYKEVEAVTSEGTRTYRNKHYKSPREVFTENHKDLLIAGEKWMKNTSSSCTVIGALIFTVMFTAAFTLPGGNKQDTGVPIFLNQKLFNLFIIFDTISLFSSTTSVLMFLGILTSRYAEEDFLTLLPKKMIIGLSMLLISIATMMTSFCAGFSLLFHKELWILAPTVVLISMPIFILVGSEFPLVVEIFVSTYGRSIFDRKVPNWLA